MKTRLFPGTSAPILELIESVSTTQDALDIVSGHEALFQNSINADSPLRSFYLAEKAAWCS